MRTVLRKGRSRASSAFSRYRLPRQLTRTAALNHASVRVLPQLLPFLLDMTPDRFPTRRNAYDAINRQLMGPFANWQFLGRFMGITRDEHLSQHERSLLWHDFTPHTPDDALSCCEVLKALSNGARTMTLLHNETDLAIDNNTWRYASSASGLALSALGFQPNTVVPYISWRILGVLDGSWSAERVISSTWRERSVVDDACEEHDTFVDADLDAGRIDDKDTSMVFHTLMSEPFLRNDQMTSEWMKALGWIVNFDPKTDQILDALIPHELARGHQGVEKPSTSQSRDSSGTTHADSGKSPRPSGWNRPRIDKNSDQASSWNQFAAAHTAIEDAKPSARTSWEEPPITLSTTEENVVQRPSWEDPPITPSTTEDNVQQLSLEDSESFDPTHAFSTSSLTDMENEMMNSSNPSTGGTLSDSNAWELLNTKKATAPGQNRETPFAFKNLQSITKKATAPGQNRETPVAFKNMQPITKKATALGQNRETPVVFEKLKPIGIRQRRARLREGETGRVTGVTNDLNTLRKLQSPDSNEGVSGSNPPVSTASSTSSPSSPPWFHAAGGERISHARDGTGAHQSSASPGSAQLTRLVRDRQGETYRDEEGSGDNQQSQLPPQQLDPQKYPFLASLGSSAGAFFNFPLIQHLNQHQKRESGSDQLENTPMRVTETHQKWIFFNEEGRSILTRPIPTQYQTQELREWWKGHHKADDQKISPAQIYLRYLENCYSDPEQQQGSIVPLMEHLVQEQQRPDELAHTTLTATLKERTYVFHDEEGRRLYKRLQPNPSESSKLRQWWEKQQQQRPRQEHGENACQGDENQVNDGKIWLLLLKQRLLHQQQEQRIQSQQPSESAAAQKQAAVGPSSPSSGLSGRSRKEEVTPATRRHRVRDPRHLTSEQLWALIKKRGHSMGEVESKANLVYWNNLLGHIRLRAGPYPKQLMLRLEQKGWNWRLLQSHERMRLQQWATRLPSEKKEATANGVQPSNGPKRWVARDEEGRVIATRLDNLGSKERRKLKQWWDEYQEQQEQDTQQPSGSSSPVGWKELWGLRAKALHQQNLQRKSATSSSANGEGAENTTVPPLQIPPPTEQQQETKEQDSSSLSSRLDRLASGKTE